MAAAAPWAGLQGSAPASTRGLSVVSYNIGARTDDTFSSEEKKPAFIKKLRQDLGELCRDAEVVCLQEASPAWSRQVQELVPPEWTGCVFLPEATLLTLWNRKLRKVTEGKALKVFPGSDSLKKKWRECLAVGLEQVDEGGMVVVVTCHTIDGKRYRKLPIQGL